jgi:hypothetical protein
MNKASDDNLFFNVLGFLVRSAVFVHSSPCGQIVELTFVRPSIPGQIDFFQFLSFIIPPTFSAFSFGWDSNTMWWLGDFSAVLRGTPLIASRRDVLNVMYAVLAQYHPLFPSVACSSRL